MKILLQVFFVLISLLFVPKLVLAEESILNFDVNIIAQRDGVMSVEEKIEYDFGSDQRHGIYRTIPLVSKVGDLYRLIEIDFIDILKDGEEENYQVDKQAKEIEVKIGDPNKTITGAHIYSIKYNVKNGIGSNYDDHDEIYWNVTGNDWEVLISSASANITTDFGVSLNKVVCFTRPSNFNAQFCTFPNDSLSPITTTAALNPGDGLTIVARFPVNTFSKSTLIKDEPFVDPDLITFLKILVPIYGLLNLILAPGLIYWYFKNKKKSRFGPVSVNFDMPEYPKGKPITPAEAGTIDNTKLDKEDIVATIFDLAVRKYIKIAAFKEVLKLRPDKIDYKLVKLKDFEGLNDFEKSLMDKTFTDKKEIFIKDAKLKYTDFEDLEEKNFKSLIDRGFYTKNPKNQIAGLKIFGIISLITLNLILGVVLIWLSRKLNGRTKLGDELDFKTDGLKLFLKNMSRNYKWQAENFYFVEKMIPYAMALGFIDEYMAQLKILKPEYSPSWYTGSGNFYSFHPAFSSQMSSNVTTSAPSSSSGFSGGSSGGGGGGGGGGSW